MISSKNEYELFLRADSVANKFEIMPMKWINIRFRDLRCLRRYEYVVNCKPTLFIVRKQLLRLILSQLSVKSGIQIPINTFGKGLYLPYHGTIVVNETARFGDFCVVQAGVNVSANVCGGNHIYFGTGCKIMKNVEIADDVIIGANAVVTKSVFEQNIVVAGIPAKKINNNGYRDRKNAI